jgi:hypothetical protein
MGARPQPSGAHADSRPIASPKVRAAVEDALALVWRRGRLHRRGTGKGSRLVIGEIEHHNSRDIRCSGLQDGFQPRHLAGRPWLIREHGADADLEAARLQDLMFDRGDDEGRLVWAEIRRTIEALQAPTNGRLN